MKLIDQLRPFNTLKTRITLIFLLLILAIQAISYFTTRYSLDKNTRASAQSQLVSGEIIFNSILTEHVNDLTRSSKILTSDYGFRGAVSSNDVETIVSALDNHRTRLNADIAIFYDNSGKYVTGTANEDRQKADVAITALLKKAMSQESASGIVVMDNMPYQLVILPVKAPLVTGWVVMGFEINNVLAQHVKDLSLLETTFLIKTTAGKWIPVASTLSNANASALVTKDLNFVSEKASNHEVLLSDTHYSTRLITLSQTGVTNQNVTIALQRSLDEIAAPFKKLQSTLLLIAIIGSLIFIMAAVYIAERITKPLFKFAKIAEKYEQGDYTEAVKTGGGNELTHLANALNSMRESVVVRERKISILAYQDVLTGLPNRVAFTEALTKHTKNLLSDMRGITIIILDIDRFKQINQALGQVNADEVLKMVAQRIKSACYRKNSDIVARFAGDKFAILLPSVTADIALDVAQRILKAFDEPARVNDQSVDLIARMGVATYPNHADNVELLISRAEMAMYEAKRLQKPAVVYDEKLDLTKQQNIAFVSELKTALENDRFKFYVQPKLELRTHKIVGVESLIRMLNPQDQLVYPDQFIPQAEKTGQIAKISTWMLVSAATYYAEWVSYDVNVTIAVNLSARDLMDANLPEKLIKIITEKKIPSKALMLEITESSIMEDPQRAQDVVMQLSNLGFKISIDDFGTGYSSFAYLKNLQVNELKIDKSFIMNMTPDGEDIKIVRSTINLAHNMGLKVVAEGVETQETLDLLTQMGCDYAQGYFISRPMPVDKFNSWLIEWETKDFN